jgi:hypothetical protein
MKLRRPAALLLVVLGACNYFQDASQAEANILAPGSFRQGAGVIESVGVLPNANRGNRDPNLYRLSMRMDAGGFQQVDIDNGTFMAGEAVELTNDGRVVRVSGTSLNRVLRR